jgi:hypothetical protein
MAIVKPNQSLNTCLVLNNNYNKISYSFLLVLSIKLELNISRTGLEKKSERKAVNIQLYLEMYCGLHFQFRQAHY